jgi:hypothetical protein
MFMPGFLIPADLERMIPSGINAFEWAEVNLLASPGALVMKDGEKFRIPTLVVASKDDGCCIHYQQRRCGIWNISPFGCAFFGCGAKDEHRLANDGLMAVYDAWHEEQSLYSRIWHHLWNSDQRADAPEVRRARMAG